MGAAADQDPTCGGAGGGLWEGGLHMSGAGGWYILSRGVIPIPNPPRTLCLSPMSCCIAVRIYTATGHWERPNS